MDDQRHLVPAVLASRVSRLSLCLLGLPSQEPRQMMTQMVPPVRTGKPVHPRPRAAHMVSTPLVPPHGDAVSISDDRLLQTMLARKPSVRARGQQ